jgi:peptidoglycan/LPS O-acetylase OafA/YrhL
MGTSTTVIGAIQLLRAWAGVMVLLTHAQNDALRQAITSGGGFARCDLFPWAASVDLFFVISGFIIVHTSTRLFGAPGARREFLLRRAIRIVPLYWATTLVALAIAKASGKYAFPRWDEIVASFAFLPFARALDGQVRPIAAQGWTLNYEALFYVLFSLFVVFPRDRAVAFALLAFATIVGLGQITHPTGTALEAWSDPIILEFGLGMGLALAWRHGWRFSGWITGPVLAVALAWLAGDVAGMNGFDAWAAETNGFSRLLNCGVPMALICGALVLRHRPIEPVHPLTRAIAALGDASYALFLSHPTMIVFARKLYVAAGWATSWGYWPLVVGEVAFGLVLAIALHLYIAKPLTEALYRLLLNARPAPIPAATVDTKALDDAIKALRAVASEGKTLRKPRKNAA